MDLTDDNPSLPPKKAAGMDTNEFTLSIFSFTFCNLLLVSVVLDISLPGILLAMLY